MKTHNTEKKPSKEIVFNTFKEFRDFYAIKEKRAGSKYYKMGQDIVRKVIEENERPKTIEEMTPEEYLQYLGIMV